jgi:NAD(P) transhydrogenase subunit alpha
VGAIFLMGRKESRLSFILEILAVIAATSNIVGGFLITDRMLRMFKSSRPAKS